MQWVVKLGLVLLFCSFSSAFFARSYLIENCPFNFTELCVANLCFDNGAPLPIYAHMVIGSQYLIVASSNGTLPLLLDGPLYGGDGSNQFSSFNSYGDGEIKFLSALAQPDILVTLRIYSNDNGSLVNLLILNMTYMSDISPASIRQSCLFVEPGQASLFNTFTNETDQSTINACKSDGYTFFGSYFYNTTGNIETGTITGKTDYNNSILYGSWMSDTINCYNNNSVSGTMLMVIDTSYPTSVLSLSISPSSGEVIYEEYPFLKSASVIACNIYPRVCDVPTQSSNVESNSSTTESQQKILSSTINISTTISSTTTATQQTQESKQTSPSTIIKSQLNSTINSKTTLTTHASNTSRQTLNILVYVTILIINLI